MEQPKQTQPQQSRLRVMRGTKHLLPLADYEGQYQKARGVEALRLKAIINAMKRQLKAVKA